MNRKYKTLQTYVLWAIDMACILLSYLGATWIRYHVQRDWADPTLHYMVCVILLLFCAIYTFLADWNRDFITRGYIREFLSVIRVVLIILVGTLSVVFFFKWMAYLSRAVILHFVWLDILLTYTLRILFKTWLRRHLTSEKHVIRVVVISEQALMEETLRSFTETDRAAGYRVAASYCADEPGENINDLPSRLITTTFDEVFINTPNIPQKKLRDLFLGFQEMGVTTHYCIELPGMGKAAAHMDDFRGYNVLTYSMERVSYKRLFIKRLIDILGGLVGLILTGILTLFIAPAIKLDSPGPVFFSQIRIGKNGRRFRIYKFRSMYRDAEEKKKELEARNEMQGPIFKMENDPRITKVGSFLRKTSLDEFPQFLNVFKGDMSLVGTRPPTEEEFAQYNEHYRRRLSMTPGLTGLWQISGRSDIPDFDEVVRLDLEYIDNWSLTEDFKILVRTVGVVLFGRGAK